MIRRLVPSGRWAAVALLVLAATSPIETSAAAATSASGLAQPPGCPAAPDLGTAVPVLLVHGLGEGPDVWSAGSPSMAGAIGAIPGVKVVSFDYKAEHTQWVTNHLIGACLATWITSLADASGGPGKVIIVAHSMGGLAVRCAVDPKCVNTDNTGAAWRTADVRQIRLVITLGTPNTGSFAVTTGGKLTSAGQIACPAILALKVNPNLPPQPCPAVVSEFFGGNSPAAQAMGVGPDGKPSKALNALPPLPSTIALDAIAGQIATTTTLFGHPPFLVSGPNFPGDLIVSPASALDGAPPTSPAHPGTSTPHPGPGSGAVTIPCGTMSILSVTGLPDTVVPDVTCWHLTETTDTAWQAAVITAVRAAAAALAAAPCTASALASALNATTTQPGGWTVVSHACHSGYALANVNPTTGGMEAVAIFKQQGSSWKVIYGPIEGLCLAPPPLPSYCQHSPFKPPLPWLVLRSLMGHTGSAVTPEFYVHNGYELGSLYKYPNFPAKIGLNNGAYLSGLRWTQVNSSSATATGILNVNNCTPSCAGGTYIQYPVRLLSSNPQQCTVAVYQRHSSTSQQVQAYVFNQIQVTALSGNPPSAYIGTSPPDLPPACG